MFELLGGKPILAHSLQVFQDLDICSEIVVVCRDDEIGAAEDIVGRFNLTKVRHIVAGGKQRQDSVRMGLEHVHTDIVAIHDAARPLVSEQCVQKSVEAAIEHGGAVVAVPVIDTIKRVEDGFVHSTIERSNLFAIQTPQTFKTELIRQAHKKAYEEQFYSTDDAALAEWMGLGVAIVEGSYDNLKITTPADMQLAHARLGLTENRTGFGYDVHRLVEGRALVLGGVQIDHSLGLMGHSDADVLVHALCDALLGAANLGDIGKCFPDSDRQYKNIRSIVLLERVGELLAQNGWKLSNADIVLVCPRPKIGPLTGQMAENIASALGVEPSKISIKGTTTEGLGFAGREEGISCYAVVNIACR